MRTDGTVEVQPHVGGWSVSHLNPFTPREGNSTTWWIGGWVNPWAGLHTVAQIEISCPCWELNEDSSVIQPILWPLSQLSYQRNIKLGAT